MWFVSSCQARDLLEAELLPSRKLQRRISPPLSTPGEALCCHAIRYMVVVIRVDALQHDLHTKSNRTRRCYPIYTSEKSSPRENPRRNTSNTKKPSVCHLRTTLDTHLPVVLNGHSRKYRGKRACTGWICSTKRSPIVYILNQARS